MEGRGLALGFAYRHNFDQKVTNYQREDALERARRSEQRAQMKMMYEGVEKMPDIIGEYDRNVIKTKYEGLLTDLGKIFKNNPNWDTDPDIYAEIQKTKMMFFNDEDVRRGIMSTEQFKQMQEFIQKNPDANPAKMKEIRDMWGLYSATGTLDGVNKSPFTFVNPGKAFNMEEYLMGIGMKMKSDDIQYNEVGAFETLSIEKARRMAYNLLNMQNDESFQIMSQFREMVSNGQIDKGTHPVDYVASRIMDAHGKNYNASLTAAYGGSQETVKEMAKPYHNVFKKSVNRTLPEYTGMLIDWDKSSNTIRFNSENTPVLLKTDLANTAKLFDPVSGALNAENKLSMEPLRGLEMFGRPTGKTVLLASGPEGDMRNGTVVGVETLIEIPFEKNQDTFDAVMEFLVENNMAEDNDWRAWPFNIDTENYKFATPRNVYFGQRKNEKGEDEPVLNMKLMVPHNYSEDVQVAFDQANLGVTDKTRSYSNLTKERPYTVETYKDENGQQFRVRKFLDTNDYETAADGSLKIYR
jgi:hypothetical protein